MYSQNYVHHSCRYGGKLTELRKEEVRKEKAAFQALSSGVTHKCPPAGLLGPATGPMWITHERGYMYQRLSGEVDSYKFYLLTKLPLFIR